MWNMLYRRRSRAEGAVYCRSMKGFVTCSVLEVPNLEVALKSLAALLPLPRDLHRRTKRGPLIDQTRN